jgi:hypothetical protein
MLPLHFVGPIGRAHLALGNVGTVASLEAGALGLHRLAFASLGLASSLCALLAKPNCLDLIANLGNDDVRLFGMARRCLWLVIARDTSAGQPRIACRHLDQTPPLPVWMFNVVPDAEMWASLS